MRPESVPAPSPAPFHHPYYETPRTRDLRRFREEIRAAVAAADAQRRRLAGVRILEARA